MTCNLEVMRIFLSLLACLLLVYRAPTKKRKGTSLPSGRSLECHATLGGVLRDIPKNSLEGDDT